MGNTPADLFLQPSGNFDTGADPFNINSHLVSGATSFKDTTYPVKVRPSPNPITTIVPQDLTNEDALFLDSVTSVLGGDSSSTENSDATKDYSETLSCYPELKRLMTGYLDQLQSWGGEIIDLPPSELADAIKIVDAFILFLESDYRGAKLDELTLPAEIIQRSTQSLMPDNVIYKPITRNQYFFNLGHGVVVVASNFKKPLEGWSASQKIEDTDTPTYAFTVEKYVSSSNEDGYVEKSLLSVGIEPDSKTGNFFNIDHVAYQVFKKEGTTTIQLTDMGERIEQIEEQAKKDTLISAAKAVTVKKVPVEKQNSVTELCTELPILYKQYIDEVTDELRNQLVSESQIKLIEKFKFTFNAFFESNNGNLEKFVPGNDLEEGSDGKTDGVNLNIKSLNSNVEYRSTDYARTLQLRYTSPDGGTVMLYVEIPDPDIYGYKEDGTNPVHVQYQYESRDAHGNIKETIENFSIYTKTRPLAIDVKEQGSEEVE